MVNDNRIHVAAERWRTRQQSENPDMETKDFTQGFLAFMQGWHARAEAAEAAFTADDFDIFRDQVALHQKAYQRIWDDYLKLYASVRAKDRTIDGLRRQVAIMGGDPLDAPAYKRIVNQRQEIKRLNAVVAELTVLNEVRQPLSA